MNACRFFGKNFKVVNNNIIGKRECNPFHIPVDFQWIIITFYIFYIQNLNTVH